MMTAVVKKRFQRAIELLKRTLERSKYLKLVLLGGTLLLIGLIVVFSDHSPNLAHVRIAVLSAGPQGNYHEIVDALSAEARRQKGHIDNIPSAGSVENIARLAAGQASCDVQFALVQEGMNWPASYPTRACRPAAQS